MGVEKLNNLAVLYASNNKISSFDDIAASTKLPELKELLLAGNPLYKEWADKGENAQYRIEVRDTRKTLNYLQSQLWLIIQCLCKSCSHMNPHECSRPLTGTCSSLCKARSVTFCCAPC